MAHKTPTLTLEKEKSAEAKAECVQHSLRLVLLEKAAIIDTHNTSITYYIGGHEP